MFRSGEVVRALDVQYQSGGWQLTLEGHTTAVSGALRTASILSLNMNGAQFEVTAHPFAGADYLFWRGRTYVLHGVDPMAPFAVDAGAARGLRAPMPGRILELIAAPGAIVRKGAPLLMLEAMKIEHTILAPAAGVLTAFRVAAGEQVAEGAELVSFEPTPAAKE